MKPSDLTIVRENLSIRIKAGDISKPQRGVYLHMIEGLDGTWRFLVGQSENMSFTIRRQHQNFRYRRDNPSLHSYAMQNSCWDHFVLLAVLPPSPTAAGFSQAEQGLLLNMLEMWCALLFCTLQPGELAHWHEYGAAAASGKPWAGLNLACPLDHGRPGKYVNWRHGLGESDDSLARAYVVEVLDRKRDVTPARGFVYGVMITVVASVLIVTLSGPQGGGG